MKTIDRTFYETANKYLKPIFLEPLISLRAFFTYFIWAIWPVIHIIFIQGLVFQLEEWNKESFLNLIIFYGIFVLVYEIIFYISRKWWWVETVNSYRKIIHWEYIDKFITIENNSTEKLWTWKIIALLDRWIDTWALWLDKWFQYVLKILVAFIYSCYMVFSVNIYYWILFLIFYILIHLVWWYFNEKTLIHRRKRQSEWNNYTKKLVKIIMSKYEILQASSAKNEINSLDKSSEILHSYSLKMATPIHIFFRLPEWFITIAKFIVLTYLWLWILEWNYTMSIFVWIFWVLTLMDSVINRSMVFYWDFTKDFTKVEKMWDFFDNTPQIKWYNKWEEFKHKIWEIKIKNLCYWYTKGKYIFNNFNLKLKWEKITALVWNSWSWKSTLIKLIAWYIRPNNWKIVIDDQGINNISLKSYYKDIWYLIQEPSVFDWTVLDNLTYAVDRKLKKWELEKILKLSKCEFIYDLPNWLETEIWEKWIRLSWGQRQRLAIAKIFLKDPKIILLDEPTSALDSFSEELITKAMHNLFKW
jgi:ABC-type multidrug transport system fused ATPase/permease subunit